jgi:P27 family predicted phage terminase small subunit
MGARGRKSASEMMTPPLQLVEPPLPIELPPAPEHLSPAMKRWWERAVADYSFDDHHLHVLLCACDSYDRMVEARQALHKEGLTVVTKNGTKAHPCVNIERDARISLMRAIRELDLDEPVPPPSRYVPPPSLRSNRRR